MRTIGLELCDAGFLTAACENNDPRVLNVPDLNGAHDWPGFAYHDGKGYSFGRAAEDQWFVHPRRVAHNFWARLAHEPAAMNVAPKPPAFSELAFFFLREFTARLQQSADAYEQIVLAIPGAYLKDAPTTDEKIGLLLGMAAELKLPLAGVIDMGCAALCDPRASGFNAALPVVLVDVHLEGADVTLFTTEDRLERKDFIHLPQSGYAQLLKHLTGTMGNRFLRHTTFDILEDGRIEQTFFRQLKEFLFNHAPEHRLHINTQTRAYEMVAKREQLASDAQAFVSALAQSISTFVHDSPHASDPCTIALTDRAAHLPGLETRLRAAGFARLLKLPAAAAACGAARIGARLRAPADIADVPVETSVPLADVRRASTGSWVAKIQKQRHHGAALPPTHAILEGVGHVIGGKPRFTIGLADLRPDVQLPESFNAVDDCSVSLVQENGRLWFVDSAGSSEANGHARTAVDAGDRLTVRCGGAAAEILFAHCPPLNGGRSSLD